LDVFAFAATGFLAAALVDLDAFAAGATERVGWTLGVGIAAPTVPDSRPARKPHVIEYQLMSCRFSIRGLSFIEMSVSPAAMRHELMTQLNADPLSVSRKVLRILITLNWLFGAAILGLLIWTFVAGEWVARALGADDDPRLVLGMRLIMVIGVAAAPIANVIFSRLLWIVETVRAGDPFVTENASRLQTIAWAVLALELSRLVVVGIANSVSTATRPIHIDLNLSVTPWLAVLLLFVLGRVFDHGARMREELEGTV
jgi:hypothetical protein